MARNRAAAQAFAIDFVNKVDPSKRSGNLLNEFFQKMDDDAFHNYYLALKNKKDYLSVIMDNLNGSKIRIDGLLDLAEELGCQMFHKVWQTDDATGLVWLSNKKYLVIDLPVRRQIQTLVNKISIPEDTGAVDELTDQPTGASKGSSISLPELLVMYSMGAVRSIEEFMRFRGGDIPLMNEMDRQILESGGASMDVLGRLPTRVKSTQVLSTFFTAMHISNNF